MATSEALRAQSSHARNIFISAIYDATYGKYCITGCDPGCDPYYGLEVFAYMSRSFQCALFRAEINSGLMSGN